MDAAAFGHWKILGHSPRLRRVLAAAGWSAGISDDTFADALSVLGFEVLVEVQTGACITDYTPKEVPAVAIALLMETRWWIENTAFHELAGQWSLDRAFVHSGRPKAVVAIVALALLAYNALQAYLYRELGINPSRPERTLGDIRRDFWETLALFTLKGLARARAP